MPDLTARDKMLIASVRMYLQAWGYAAGEWAAAQAGLTKAQTAIALDQSEPVAYRLELCEQDSTARIIVYPIDGVASLLN